MIQQTLMAGLAGGAPPFSMTDLPSPIMVLSGGSILLNETGGPVAYTDRVTTWPGAGGTDSPTQASQANRPTYLDGAHGINGLPAIRSTISPVTFYEGGTVYTLAPCTLYAVLSVDDLSAYQAFIGSDTSGALTLDITQTTGILRALGQSAFLIGSSTTPIAAATPVLIVFTIDAGGVYAWRINRTAAGSGTGTPPTGGKIRVPSLGEPFAGKMPFLGVYGAVHSGADITRAETLLQGLYATP